MTESTFTPIPETAPGEGQLTCEECGISFEHSGRGRKPKRCLDCRNARPTTGNKSTVTRRAGKDVNAALAVMDSAYAMMTVGLMMFSPKAASEWADKLESLRAQNRLAFEADASLCKSICRAGEKSGKAMFYGSHALAIVPVIGSLATDLKSRRKLKAKSQKPKTTPASNGFSIDDGPTVESKPVDSFWGVELP